MDLIPTDRVGVVKLLKIPPVFLGTTFAFRSGRHFLTAAHCVGDAKPSELAVELVGHGSFRVAEVDRHPQADLALLVLGADATTEAWRSSRGEPALGQQLGAFGFPENTLGGEELEKIVPTPRSFTCSTQRFFPYRSFAGYGYMALEMSIPAPPGLSGGPLFPADYPDREVIAVVAENFDSTTLLHALEETDGTKTRYERVISYGVGVWLEPLQDWLESRVPSSHDFFEWRKKLRAAEKEV
jgi:hypothetical protein